MEACELVRLILNKVTVPAEPKRAGNPGYGIKTAIRVLVYARLKGLENDTRIIWHLKRQPQDAHTLGLGSIPDRTTIGRWWTRYFHNLEDLNTKIADIIKDNIPTTRLIVDSTPLKDMHDLEAQWGWTCKGPIKGFKLHVAVNQLGLPLRAIVTSANHYDSKFLPKLIEDLEADYVLADAGYDSIRNIQAVKGIGAVPVIAVNPRRKGKKSKTSNAMFFGGRRWPVEQFNGHCKANVLRGCWVRPRGLLKKASMVMAGLVCVNIFGIAALLEGGCGLKEASKCWE
jgi:IS5 family transposase